ncbi:MAG: DNA N-glycosylase and apurinic/apyrimidinic (AP) lyase [Peltula sp. TS41687]|nr:MAG: DNA N-glycosylase and apurinic/apyrimidinic (AP) lyase [Peltula sp. TS41687]
MRTSKISNLTTKLNKTTTPSGSSSRTTKKATPEQLELTSSRQTRSFARTLKRFAAAEEAVSSTDAIDDDDDDDDVDNVNANDLKQSRSAKRERDDEDEDAGNAVTKREEEDDDAERRRGNVNTTADAYASANEQDSSSSELSSVSSTELAMIEEEETMLDDDLPLPASSSRPVQTPINPSPTKRRSPRGKAVKKPKLDNYSSSSSSSRDHQLPSTTSSTKAAHDAKEEEEEEEEQEQEANNQVTIHPPKDWLATYNTMKAMRARILAPVDTMGCERLADPNASPRTQRFQTLLSLLLSSQTKDTTTSSVIRRMQRTLPAPGLTLETILSLTPSSLNAQLQPVGFHNVKTRAVLATARILRDRHGGDIPRTYEGLVALPGVGPKMAHLALTAAWGRTEGIAVDTHVLRVTRRWGWHAEGKPEEARRSLQAWLPRRCWAEINRLLVGFGQTVCLPRGRRCGVCEVGRAGEGKGRCGDRLVGGKGEEEEEEEEEVEGGGGGRKKGKGKGKKGRVDGVRDVEDCDAG